MITVGLAAMRAITGGGSGKGLGMAALKLVPTIAAAGAGGYLAYQATAAAGSAMQTADAPRPDHQKAVVGAFSLVPAIAAGSLAIGAAWKIAGSTVRKIDEVQNVDTGEMVRLARHTARGWNSGAMMLRGAGVGAFVGAAVAAGVAGPLIMAASSLAGQGANEAMKSFMPDWMMGAVNASNATTVQVMTTVVGGVVQAVAPETTRHSFESTIEIDPAKGFDPMRDLGIDGTPEDVTVMDGDAANADVQGMVEKEILDRIETASGTRPTPVTR